MPEMVDVVSGRDFRIVTHRNWLADQFKPYGAVQDFGFDINPDTAGETLWWAPGAWVASARKAGVVLPLLSCGPRWLDRLPYKYRRRPVATIELSRLTNNEPAPSFVKLPEAKVDSCEARIYSTPRLADTWRQFGFPSDTLVQVQGVVEFIAEARFFVAHGAVVGESLYRFGDTVWGDVRFTDSSPLPTMRSFAEKVVAEVPQPPGWVLDVGMTPGGVNLVIEANAAWSSGPYDCDPDGVVQALVAAHDFEGRYPEWAWQHNPVFDSAGPLRVVA